MRSASNLAIAAGAAALAASSAPADVTIQYTPTDLEVGQTVNLSIRLVANPGASQNVAGITFNFDDASDAWAAINPTSFTWIPGPMQNPGQWLTDESLPSPMGLALFPAAAIAIPAGGSVEFARLTVTPVAGGEYDWSSNISPLFASNGVPLQIKGGDPVTLTVSDDSPGACCLADGGCTDVSPDECAAAGGAFEGPGTICTDVRCPEPMGACCLGDGSCAVTTLNICEDVGAGTFAGPDTDCADDNENGHADVCTCAADIDENGVVGTGDLLALLASWGSPGGPADLDMSGTVGTNDLLLLLGMWGGCF